MTEENNSGRVDPDVPEFSQQPPPPTGAPEEQTSEPARTDQPSPDQTGVEQAGPDQTAPPQPPLEQAPASPPAPGAGPAPSAPVQPQPWTPTSQDPAGAQQHQAQDAPPSEAPWSSPPPVQEGIPSPEEDAALREQRARRFGAGAESTEASDETATTQLPSEQPASPFPPVVTPIPASPHTSSYGTGTTQQFPAGPGPYPGAQPAPGYPVPGHPVQAHPRPDDDFEGLREAPASRAAAHWWTILISLVFIPVAWYLVTDAGARIEWFLSQGQPVTVAAYFELGLGLLAVFIFLLAARWSSVGSIVMGSIFLALGIAFLIFPAEGTNLLTQSTEYFGRLGQFGINVVEHLSETLTTGRMTLYGLTLIMVGVVSHGARRQGRREERTKIALGE